MCYANKPEDVWKKIHKGSPSECWEWNGARSSNGYGHMRINYTDYLVHRIVYELIKGKIPEGLFILHTCDNRLCCNPNHLGAGTQQDNMIDMVLKSRSCPQYGELNNAHKLEEQDIIKIKSLYASGKYYQKEIGKMFNVSQTSISLIVRNINWNYINRSG
jgi:hypothetical protein